MMRLQAVFPLGMLLCIFMTAVAPAQEQDQPAQRQSAQRQQPAQQQRVKNWLANMDKNGDGKIARDESTGLMKTNFARVDADSDGFLDREELDKLAERLGRRRPNNNARRRTMTTEQLLKQAPEGVVIEPDIAYRPGDSKAWRLDLARPAERGARPRPAIVFVHGGGWRSGDKRRGTFLQGALEYAQRGYVCVTINYRLVDEAQFPACIEDCKCAVRWLRANAEKYHIDPERIGGYGNSAGAHLVAMLGLAKREAGLEGDGPYQDQSSMLQAVCCSATPTDFGLFRRRREGAAGERGAKVSPITYVSADAPPFLIIHGTADTTVNVEHGDRFHEALKKAGAKDVTYLRIEAAGHGVFSQHAAKTRPAMREFFRRTIGGSAEKE